MSTRWYLLALMFLCVLYPLYQRGNPQLRIFLPNFWMKLIKPKYPLPENVVNFSCSMQMTKYDIKEYLTKIYKLPFVDVRTRIQLGRYKQCHNRRYIIKDDDMKLAFVVLPETEKFVYPDIFPDDVMKKDMDEYNKSMDEAKVNFRNYLEKNRDRPGLPNWYSI